jgi:hypothetical protein
VKFLCKNARLLTWCMYEMCLLYEWSLVVQICQKPSFILDFIFYLCYLYLFQAIYNIELQCQILSFSFHKELQFVTFHCIFWRHLVFWTPSLILKSGSQTEIKWNAFSCHHAKLHAFHRRWSLISLNSWTNDLFFKVILSTNNSYTNESH